MTNDLDLSAEEKSRYKYRIQGAWASFESPAGKVMFIMTKAKLGARSSDDATELTSVHP